MNNKRLYKYKPNNIQTDNLKDFKLLTCFLTVQFILCGMKFLAQLMEAIVYDIIQIIQAESTKNDSSILEIQELHDH